MTCACIKCIHNDGRGYCEDSAYISIDEYGCCDDLVEVVSPEDEEEFEDDY